MFLSIEESKEFILWCKEQKLKKVKWGNLEFEVSDLAIVEQMTESPTLKDTESNNLTSKTMADTADNSEDEDLLYWSTNK